MRSQLMSVAGVQKVDISYDDKTATVTVNKNVDPASVAGALKGQYSGKIHTP